MPAHTGGKRVRRRYEWRPAPTSHVGPRPRQAAGDDILRRANLGARLGRSSKHHGLSAADGQADQRANPLHGSPAVVGCAHQVWKCANSITGPRRVLRPNLGHVLLPFPRGQAGASHRQSRRVHARLHQRGLLRPRDRLYSPRRLALSPPAASRPCAPAARPFHRSCPPCLRRRPILDPRPPTRHADETGADGLFCAPRHCPRHKHLHLSRLFRDAEPGAGAGTVPLLLLLLHSSCSRRFPVRGGALHPRRTHPRPPRG
mmetsp:Transcript_5824/g.18561  ORF Transcript_5824/g.18561 Transcript_5824/m.18561 type:complete len:259 (+) Transcript_5824:793-1569(+)